MTLRILVLACILMSASFLLFSGTLGFDFVNWDDDIYVYNNKQVMSGEDPVSWFSRTYYYSYIPLTMLSHTLDYAVFGGTPRGHHLTNIILHAFNTGWLFLFGLALFGRKRQLDWGALAGMAGVALLFALHPLRTESVAWISDRKDLLCAFFLLPASISYLQYLGHQKGPGGRVFLVLSFFLFVCAALSKSVAIGFPLIMLGMDWYLSDPEPRKAGWKERIVAKWPFFLVSAVLAIVLLLIPAGGKQTYVVEQLHGMDAFLFPFFTFMFYLYKSVFPASLSPIYPAVSGVWLYSSFILFGLISAAVVLAARRGHRSYGIAWMTYLVFLIPTVVGLSSGMQAQADRFSYLATMPVFLLLGGGVALLIGRGSGFGRLLASTAICVLVLVFASMTLRYLPVWADSESLWRYVYEAFPPSRDYSDAYVNLGCALAERMELPEAETVLKTAASVDPENADAFYNLAHVSYLQGDWEQALELFRQTTVIDSMYSRGYYNYAIVSSQLGSDSIAIPAMKHAARLGLEEAQVALRERGMSYDDSPETPPLK